MLFLFFFPNLTENDNKMKMKKIGLPLNLCLRLPRWLELFQFGPATLMLVNTSIYTIENYLHHILIRITSIFFLYIYDLSGSQTRTFDQMLKLYKVMKIFFYNLLFWLVLHIFQKSDLRNRLNEHYPKTYLLVITSILTKQFISYFTSKQ